ncbi:hypothetical protein [Rhodococcus cercidiphylli]|uniref:Uncharacterized protein n=1 Tax=Rhodococcus cercidiphylli TaxID=489916 RepID=A0ABU4B0F2_9NOCA|nr:hypothetical protein [Rhodococcus cercidiphylli]MDV6231941.1 hypothetical protein [Rhodococcus cercidiphylli]
MVDFIAHEQYDVFTGSVAADDADFESIEKILGFDESASVLGFRVSGTHPMLTDGGAANSSYTYLTAWVVDSLKLEPNRPVDVTEYQFHTAELEYDNKNPTSFGVLLRALKRVSVTLWRDRVHSAGLTGDHINVVSTVVRVREGDKWVTADEWAVE